MTIYEAYEAAAREHDLVPDPAQRRIVDALADLQHRIVIGQGAGSRLRRMLSGGGRRSGVRGIYLWGDVGRGKTFLLDLFFRSLDIEAKRRSHFHRMMSDVHRRLKALGNIEDPLDRVAADIAAETRVLCFDEFFVSDIGDAMILGKLLDGLFRRGVTLVATSNARPQDLYRDGLQRQRFMPAIEAIEAHTDVIELDGGVDYRLRLLDEAGTYLCPNDGDAVRALDHYFSGIASGETRIGETIEVLGREISTVRHAKGIAWFDFADLCDGPRSQEDYIEIARWYPAVIVSDVPALAARHDDRARRFIALVDEFYDRRVKLILSAETGIDGLYTGNRLAFEFQRTASRLTEMQTEAYLHAPHLA
ncbi:MAG: cell division protein ZapE [Gammaproteobacteria bacterium]|nr:cell division protein ZapE [Gammaproteobacteria bacterium]